jgi:hypothetical protein
MLRVRMRFSLLFVFVFACGSVAPVDKALPLTRETCDSKLYRANDSLTELILDRDMHKAIAREAKEEASICQYQMKLTHKKLVTCNILTSIYDNQLLNDGCITKVTNEDTHQEEQP